MKRFVLVQLISLAVGLSSVPAAAQSRTGGWHHFHPPAAQSRTGGWHQFGDQTAPRTNSAPRQIQPQRQMTPRQGGWNQSRPAPRQITPSRPNRPTYNRPVQPNNSVHTYAYGGAPAPSGPGHNNYGGDDYRNHSRSDNGRGSGHRYHDGRGWHSMLWYNGGWGYWYGLPQVWCPVYGYNPYDGYGYGGYGYPGVYTPYYVGVYGYGYVEAGIKFDIPGGISGTEKKILRNGVVYVDGAEIGSVGKLTGAWHGAMQLSSGTHDVVVVLEDGRQLETTVGVEDGRVTHITLLPSRFTASQEQQ